MSKIFRNIAIIMAAGQGTRLSNEKPKQYFKINGQTLLEISINKFLDHPKIDAVIAIISQDHQELYATNINSHPKLLEPTYGGMERQDSVRLALEHIKKYTPEIVLIHDAARIMFEPRYIDQLIEALENKSASCLVTRVADTTRYIRNSDSKIVPRENLFSTQTPQVFRYQSILALHHKFKDTKVTDDIALLELDNEHNIEFIDSTMSNFKVTTKEDYELAKKMMKEYTITKVGFGFDAHRFKETPKKDNTIMLSGVEVPCKYEIIAHSDGDVVLHAVTDALLGAIGKGDIGQHFPPSDDKWKNASSDQFVKFACDLLKEKNAIINNVDITIIAETPRISSHRDEMTISLAKILEIEPANVNIKATTTEGMGFTGRKEGIACKAIVAIKI